jgi:ABC-type amino acid transport substrate-binding protein
MFVRASAFIGMVLLVAACSAAHSPGPERAPRRAPQASLPANAPSSVLRVGTSGDYAPFSTRDAAGKFIGFDAELAEELARDLGFELRWVPFRWPELKQQIAANEFDVAMGGVTWQPARAVSGYMSRSVARGGPCVLGDADARHIAVNRGGVLEAWAQRTLAGRELVTVDDNQSLPTLLAEGRVGAIVTDSFEIAAFARPGWSRRCEPALSRKVYWVAPAQAHPLGERIDDWLRANVARVQIAQERWFGERQRIDAATHLVDLLARRFAFMPLVAAQKAQRDLPIEDLPREREVLAAVAAGARRAALPEQPTVDFFALQIELSKVVQRRQSEPSALDLAADIRPALNHLGDRILDAVAEARRLGKLAELVPADLELLSPWLTPEEREQMRAALLALAAS